MFELVDGEKKRQIAFSNDTVVYMDDLKFEDRVYFIHGIYNVCTKPKYIEFISIHSDTKPSETFLDFKCGRKVIYGYTCYDTTKYRFKNNVPYEHSLTFMQNK